MAGSTTPPPHVGLRPNVRGLLTSGGIRLAGPATTDRMSQLEAAWDEVHAANTMGWQVGRPYLHDERRCWQQYARST